MRWLARGAPVPVFPLVGLGGADLIETLRLDLRVRIVDSPRWASILLVAGRLPAQWLKPALRVHDQLPHPRATVCIGPGGGMHGERLFPEAERVSGDPAEACRRVQAELLTGARASEEARRPDVPAARWRGVGPHGQGGKGMMGGRPYGRPMAMTGDDRDGLRLDRLNLPLGPFFPPFPAGLTLQVVLQGDLVQEAVARPNPFDVLYISAGVDPFARALHERVTIAELETRRARDHLRWLARGLDLLGLAGLATRARFLAAHCARHEDVARAAAASGAVSRPDGEDAALREDAGAIRHLWTVVERLRMGGPSTRGIGRIDAHNSDERWGPVARASGLDVDARTDDDAYDGLGFEPVRGGTGDAWARWRQRTLEAEQGLRLAADAGDRRREPGLPIEAPEGRLDSDAETGGVPLEFIDGFLPGLEWGDAVAALHSLDLNLERSARHGRVHREESDSYGEAE